MPTFSTFLSDKPIEFLQIVAHGWKLVLPESGLEAARMALASAALDTELVAEVVEALPGEVWLALSELTASSGRLPWDRFSRKHGGIRPMGAARLERLQPERSPASTAEVLYFLGLLGRAFFDTPEGPREFAYVPDDLLPLLPTLPVQVDLPLGRPAREDEYQFVHPASDVVLDDACTLLAGLRSRREYEGDPDAFGLAVDQSFLGVLLRAHGLIDALDAVRPEATRSFLEAGRGEALAGLVQTWLGAIDLDDLRLVPGLDFEGDWRNDPLRTRQAVLGLVDRVPAGEWWNLAAFIAAAKTQQFDFQRRGPSFDTWYILDAESGEFLRGVENWDRVEGRLLHWILTGPLHWLGLVDLAGPGRDAAPAAFRLSAWSGSLRTGESPPGFPAEDARIHVRSDGRISAGHLVPRAARYLVSRFCDWEEARPSEYRYRPTPTSLQQAADSGLQIDQLIALLARHTDGIPPNVTMALKNWQRQGQAARIQAWSVLQVPSPEALQALRGSRAARFLGEILGPAAVAVTPGAESQVIAALMELGYLGEVIS